MGASLQFGVGYSFVFGELSGTWLARRIGTIKELRDSEYTALGINLGFAPDFVPVEVYGGYELAGYQLMAGTATTFTGSSLKAGARLLFSVGNPNLGKAWGIVAEYRKTTLDSDEAGPLPAGFTTFAHSYMIGMTYGSKSPMYPSQSSEPQKKPLDP